VILIDTNLLLYAAVEEYAQHALAHEWLDAQLASASRVGLPWHSLLGFVRLVSNRSTFKRGPSVNEAWQTVRVWLSRPNVWIPHATERHADVLSELFATATVTSRKVMDLHLAALAIEHGLTVCSNDSDFARYPNVRWLNPLDG
jgi:toxin-antitoxin system PIN domain toxin